MAKKSRDRWPELCELVADDDGLAARPVGPWSAQKLWFWARYIDITTNAMVGHPNWPAGLVYVDLFAGPGVCKVKNTDDRVPGSPLIAAHALKPFRNLLLCERNRRAAKACEERMRNTPVKDVCQVLQGDCNDLIDDIVRRIPKGSLTLAFVDPTGLHARIETMTRLSAAGQVDLVVLFPDAMDVVRNAEAYYLKQPDSKLDHVLGAGSDWRAEWKSLGSHAPADLRRWFAGKYRDQLRDVAGYEYFGEEVMRGPHGPLYRLVFATKHPRGLDFWDKVTRKELGGQGRFHWYSEHESLGTPLRRRASHPS